MNACDDAITLYFASATELSITVYSYYQAGDVVLERNDPQTITIVPVVAFRG
jgi:hypothetical protein